MRQLTGRIAGMPAQFGAAFGFVAAPFERVSREFTDWHAELGFRPRRTLAEVGLEAAAVELLPLSSTPYARSLLVGTLDDVWTAYFDSQESGGDPRGAVGVMGRRLGVTTVVVHAMPFSDTPEAVAGRFGSLQWEYSPDGSLESQRSVALVEGEVSSRAHFEAWGPVQPWEASHLYLRDRQRDRLTAEAIEAYCRAVDIDPFNLNYYTGPSMLVERTS